MKQLFTNISVQTLAIGLTVLLWAGQTYPMVSYFNQFRNWFSSRISEASDEEVAFLAQQEDVESQMYASAMNITRADVAKPFVTAMLDDQIGMSVKTPINQIGINGTFDSVYNWFAKKLTPQEIIPTIAKVSLVGAVIFCVTQVAEKGLVGDRVRKNYYANKFVNRFIGRMAMLTGLLLVGSLE